MGPLNAPRIRQKNSALRSAFFDKWRTQREKTRTVPARIVSTKRLPPSVLFLKALAFLARDLWRTLEDSNLWPLPSEGSALSS